MNGASVRAGLPLQAHKAPRAFARQRHGVCLSSRQKYGDSAKDDIQDDRRVQHRADLNFAQHEEARHDGSTVKADGNSGEAFNGASCLDENRQEDLAALLARTNAPPGTSHAHRVLTSKHARPLVLAKVVRLRCGHVVRGSRVVALFQLVMTASILWIVRGSTSSSGDQFLCSLTQVRHLLARGTWPEAATLSLRSFAEVSALRSLLPASSAFTIDLLREP